jgi:hypothetical protein
MSLFAPLIHITPGSQIHVSNVVVIVVAAGVVLCDFMQQSVSFSQRQSAEQIAVTQASCTNSLLFFISTSISAAVDFYYGL